MTCKFCNIAKHIKSEHIIYEDKLVIAFMSIEQLTKCHILIIPKKHYKDIFELDEKVAERIFKITTRISKIVKKVIKPDGLDIYQCNGKYAGQVIFHFHHKSPMLDNYLTTRSTITGVFIRQFRL